MATGNKDSFNASASASASASRLMQSQPNIHNMRLGSTTDGTAVYHPTSTTATTTTTSSANQPPPACGVGGSPLTGSTVPATHEINMNVGSGQQSTKRKRGRPRKYGPDVNMSLANPSPSPISSTPPPPPPPPPAHAKNNATGVGGVSAAAAATSGGSETQTPNAKKPRGRPLGSSNSKRQQNPEMGSRFTPYVVIVQTGEDVSAKILAFTQQIPNFVCVLSVNGAVSRATICQNVAHGTSVTYEGRFDILSLQGSFGPIECDGQRSTTGSLSVTLSGPDGRVIAGRVTGLLIAASPTQIVLGTFNVDDGKDSKSGTQKKE